VIPGEWWTYSPAWSADSREVFFIRAFGLANAGNDTAMYRVGVEGGEPRRVSFAGDNPWFLDVSRQGNRLAYTRLQRDINIYEAEIGADGKVGPGRAIALSSRREESADPAPDGKRLVFASNRSGPMEIWISDRQGGGLTRITTSSSENDTNNPRWSPDGSWIAYHAEVKGSSQIFVVSAAGGAPLQLTHEPGRDQLPVWSADSRSIYFASNRGGSTGIWKVPAAGGDAVTVVGDSRIEKTESPDGRWLYFRRGATLLRVPTGGGKEEQVVSDVGERGDFLGDLMCAAVTANGIYYLGRAEEGKPGSPIRFVAHSGGPPKTVGRIAKRVREGLTASRDGRYLYWSQFDVESADLRLVEGFY
jgi:Tol biopolymer transport system component